MSEQTEQGTGRPPALPVDFTAVLAAMQDQIDDLTSVVEAHARRLDELDGQAKARKN
jgi:hypothetical protein